MKYTDRELDRLLEKLIASTRSPRGKFSAAASYQILEKRLPRPALRLFSLRTLSAVAAIALLCFIGMEHLLLSETYRPTDNFHTGRYADHQTARRNGSDAEPFLVTHLSRKV